ncbi:MAG: AtpZ/AtpI family protein [Flavobacteriales bacterium]
MEEPLKPNRQRSNDFLRYSGMAVQMAVTIGLCIWAGLKLDAYLTTGRLFTLLLSLIGVIVAMYYVIKDLTRK